MGNFPNPSSRRAERLYPVLHRLLYLLLLIGFLSMLGGCNAIEFSPNQVSDRNSPTDLNAKNLEKLFANTVDDTVTIGLIGDSQRFYEHVDRFVDKANTLPNIDLFLMTGDISQFGLLQEFEWINDRLAKLHRPYISVVGNHDLVANGEAVYKRMFGPMDFSFVYDSIKIVAHNTNSLEFDRPNVPDMDWLTGQLRDEPGVKHIVTVSHVPPFSEDQFSAELMGPYTSLLRETPRLLMNLNGHVHNHNDFVRDGVRYITSFAFSQDAFVLLKIVDGRVYKTIIEY